MNIKLKVIISVVLIIFVTVIMLLFYNKSKSNDLNILYKNISQKNIERIEKRLKSEMEETDIFLTIFNEKTDINKFNLFITEEYNNITNTEETFSKIKSSTLKVIPSAIKELGLNDGKFYSVPIQIDHIEISVETEILKSITDTPAEVTLETLINGLKKHKSKSLFPLLVAGKDDTSYFDFISLLTVTYCGKPGYDNLITYIESGTNIDDFIDKELGNDINLRFILDTLIAWKREKLLHTEWLQFTNETVLKFAEDKIAGSIIMRLSEHRTYPTRVIKRFTTIEFPNNRDKKYASDVLMIPTLCAIPENSANKGLAKKAISILLERDVQKKFTASTGLAPVHSTALPLDMQSNNVRFWAASANKLVPAYYNVTGNKQIEDFILDSKNYLITNK